MFFRSDSHYVDHWYLKGLTMSFSINFAPPSHGWLPIRLRAGNSNLDFEASDVPVCSITHLVTALCAYLGGDTSAACPWFLEPKVLEFVFLSHDDKTVFVVCEERSPPYETRDHGCEGVAEPGPETTLFSVQGKTFDIIYEFHRALSALSSALPPGEWEEAHRWSWPFPVEELAQLDQLLSDMK
jgi:hypothetical protein